MHCKLDYKGSQAVLADGYLIRPWQMVVLQEQQSTEALSYLQTDR